MVWRSGGFGDPVPWFGDPVVLRFGHLAIRSFGFFVLWQLRSLVFRARELWQLVIQHIVGLSFWWFGESATHRLLGQCVGSVVCWFSLGNLISRV